MSSTNERDSNQAAGEAPDDGVRSDTERLLTRRRLLVKTALVSAPVLMSIRARAAWADGSADASPTHVSHQP